MVGGPPYDGGFLGDLALFGGFLALGQAPFVAVFVLATHGRAAERTGIGYVARPSLPRVASSSNRRGRPGVFGPRWRS